MHTLQPRHSMITGSPVFLLVWNFDKGFNGIYCYDCAECDWVRRWTERRADLCFDVTWDCGSLYCQECETLIETVVEPVDYPIE